MGLQARDVLLHGCGVCPCLAFDIGDSKISTTAKPMPKLDDDLKAIVVTPLNRAPFVRLGVLQAEADRLGW